MIAGRPVRASSCDVVFASTTSPRAARPYRHQGRGRCSAAADRWDIRITGRAAAPRIRTSPSIRMVAGANIVLALQTIVSRNIDPIDRDGRDGGLLQGRLGLQRRSRATCISAARPGTTSPENRALVQAAHRGDLPRRRADGMASKIRDRAQARLSADGQQCRAARALPYRRRRRRLRRACSGRQCPPEHGRGGSLLHAGAVPGAMVWSGNGGGGRCRQPAQLALRLQRHGHPVRRQLLRAHVERFLANNRHEHGCHPGAERPCPERRCARGDRVEWSSSASTVGSSGCCATPSAGLRSCSRSPTSP
mgnify:CR=1 FL=1